MESQNSRKKYEGDTTASSINLSKKSSPFLELEDTKNGFALTGLYFTDVCNLDCEYCYVKQRNNTMSWRTAKGTVDWIVSLPQEEKILCFMGGEPLVKWDLVKRITEYGKSKGLKRFNLCTNLTLIDQKKLDYLIQNDFKLMLSLDGIAESQNQGREYHGGQGSFESTNKAVNLIVPQKNELNFIIQMTITPFNVEYLSKSFNYILQKGLANTTINFVPVDDPGFNWTEELYGKFKVEVKKLFLMYNKNRDRLRKCKLIFGKCCSTSDPWDLEKTKHLKIEPCVSRNKRYGVDFKGDIYYCFLAGFTKYEKLRSRFKLGDVWSGIIHREKMNQLTGVNVPRCMSCLAHNYISTGHVRKPPKAYKKLYANWLTNLNVLKK